MKYLLKMSYYCTVYENVYVDANSKEEAIEKCELGDFEQIPNSTNVDIDWDSLTVL